MTATTPRLHWSFHAVLLCGLLLADGAQAQAERERVVITVEGPGGQGVADRVRRDLAKQSVAQIRSLEDQAAAEAPPRVIVAVHGTRDGMVNVLYWDVTGRVDALSAPATVDENGFALIATTLASALLRRNLPRIAKAGQRMVAASWDWLDLIAELRLQSYRPQPTSRTGPISADEF